MTDIIEHFMWGYQRYFRLIQKLHADRLLQTLDKRFESEIFIVGILVDNHNDRYPACVEPEIDFWIQSTDFDKVLDCVKKLIPTYPESRMIQSHPLAQQWQNDALSKHAIRDSIKKIVENHPGKPEEMQYYPSYPVKIEGYLISLVLGLQKEVINSYYKLSIDQVFIHDCRSFPVPISLIDATIMEYLNDVASELLKPDPGADFIENGKSVDDILRAAGNRLITAAGSKIDKYVNQNGREQLLYDNINRISSLKYEQNVGFGKIILSQKDHPAIKKIVSFKNPILINKHRASRKLLELTCENLGMYMNAKEIWGMASIVNYLDINEDLYEIAILGYHYWELRHAGNTLMYVRNGLPFLPIPNINENKIRMDIPRLFKGTQYNIDLLIALVKQAESEKHGTTLIISGNAEIEAIRLSSQAILIEPIQLTPALLGQMTPIDGAVLIDPIGICYAIGVILDGMASDMGDLARGARYNSAIRYIQMQNNNGVQCMAIIISEDGGIDYIPDLLPAIHYSLISNRMEKLKEMMDTRQCNRENLNRLADWLEKHQFYLTEKDCKQANYMISVIDKYIEKNDESAVRFIRNKLSNHPGFKPEIYYIGE